MTIDSQETISSLQNPDEDFEESEHENEEIEKLDPLDDEDRRSKEGNSEVVIVPVTPYGGSLLVTVQLNQTREARF